MKTRIGKQIRKQMRVLLFMVLSALMLLDAVPASGAFASGGYSSGLIIQGEDADGQGSRILSAKKKKKKKKNKGSSQSSQNNTSSKQESNSSGKLQDTAESKEKDRQNGQENGTDSLGKEDELTVTEDGTYTSKEEVALYIHLYDHLPDNYITKREAQDLGWSNREGNLDEVAPGKSIGGDRFGNYEGQLPEKNGRKYRECDIDFDGGYRGSKRIIYSSDGLIYYTEDHYKTFERLY